MTDVSVTKVNIESWGEFVESPLVTVMSQYEGCNNAYGDNPEARRKWMGPVGDVVVEVETDAGIAGVGHGNWAIGAIEMVVDEILSKLVVGEDPRERERLWDITYPATIPFGRKGATIEAISAVDLETLEREAIEYVKKVSTRADAIDADLPDAVNGILPLPDGVGLSSELNPEALERFAIE